jgi:hypothetical protein
MRRRQAAAGLVGGVLLLAGLPRRVRPAAAQAAGAGLPDLPPALRERAVANPSELQAALLTARPGDHIVLADGSYASRGGLRVEVAGTPSAPIVVRAGNRLRARLTTGLAIDAPDVVVAGLEIGGSGMAVAGDRARVTRCRFRGTRGIALALLAGEGAVVDRCEFVGCRGRGISIAPDGRAGRIAGPRVQRNHFREFAGEPGDNGHEAVQIGQFGGDALLQVGAAVEHNLFVGIDVDSETVSVKSSGNTIRANTFLACRSRPTNRFGNRNRWHANWIEDCRGMWIYGADHELLGNRLVGPNGEGLCVMAGNSSPEDIRKSAPAAGGREKDHSPYCRDVLVAGNTAERLVIGKVIERFGRPYDLPAIGTRVEEHAGPTAVELATGTLIAEWASVAVPTAVRLTADDVGPEAP